MFLTRLELRNFRNISSQDINLSRGITVIWGDNGEGKTNFLEAIYFLSYMRPLLRNGLAQLILKGEEEALLRGLVKSEGQSFELASSLKRGGKATSTKGGNRVGSIREYLGSLISVAFVTGDIQAIFGFPNGRRRFLDQAASIRWPIHMDFLLEYARYLRQRNRLLMMIREGNAQISLLHAFDEKTCDLGEKITIRRKEIMEGIEEKFKEVFSTIDGMEKVHIDDKGLSFSRKEFMDMRTSDIDRGMTQYGPHRSDFKIFLGGKDARLYASQGKKRLAAIALRLAQAELVQEFKKVKPLLLLDDITSEIDPGRRERLLQWIEKMGSQTVITTTSAALIEEGFSGSTRALKIQKGKII